MKFLAKVEATKKKQIKADDENEENPALVIVESYDNGQFSQMAMQMKEYLKENEAKQLLVEWYDVEVAPKAAAKMFAMYLDKMHR